MIRIWSLADKSPDPPYLMPKAVIPPDPAYTFWSAIFSPDGRTLYTVGDLHDPVRAWDAATGEPRPLPPLEQLPRLCQEFSPDNRRKVGMPAEIGYETVWDTKTERALAVLPGCNAKATAFSPDGTRIVTGNDAQVLIWRQRRPEGLLGLVVLPELWCVIALIPTLMWSIIRDRRPKSG